MPEHKCNVCGAPVWSKYSGAGLIFFCDKSHGPKVDAAIDRHRAKARKDAVRGDRGSNS